MNGHRASFSLWFTKAFREIFWLQPPPGCCDGFQRAWCALNLRSPFFPLCRLQVVSVLGKPQSTLDLKPKLNYSIQVRCSSLDNPPRWSDWSESYYIYLDSKKTPVTTAHTEAETQTTTGLNFYFIVFGYTIMPKSCLFYSVNLLIVLR